MYSPQVLSLHLQNHHYETAQNRNTHPGINTHPLGAAVSVPLRRRRGVGSRCARRGLEVLLARLGRTLSHAVASSGTETSQLAGFLGIQAADRARGHTRSASRPASHPSCNCIHMSASNLCILRFAAPVRTFGFTSRPGFDIVDVSGGGNCGRSAGFGGGGCGRNVGDIVRDCLDADSGLDGSCATLKGGEGNSGIAGEETVCGSADGQEGGDEEGSGAHYVEFLCLLFVKTV